MKVNAERCGEGRKESGGVSKKVRVRGTLEVDKNKKREIAGKQESKSNAEIKEEKKKGR